MKKYTKLDNFVFYYYVGLAYYDKKKNEQALKWYNYAMQIDDKSYKLMNSLGIVYD
jgi:tetratricopeptide (TPR) repeat protein